MDTVSIIVIAGGVIAVVVASIFLFSQQPQQSEAQQPLASPKKIYLKKRVLPAEKEKIELEQKITDLLNTTPLQPDYKKDIEALVGKKVIGTFYPDSNMFYIEHLHFAFYKDDKGIWQATKNT